MGEGEWKFDLPLKGGGLTPVGKTEKFCFFARSNIGIPISQQYYIVQWNKSHIDSPFCPNERGEEHFRPTNLPFYCLPHNH